MRSDDILGPYIVENYDNSTTYDCLIPDRKVLPQLDIILAEDFPNYDKIILVDARQDDEENKVIVKKYDYMSCGPTAAHSSHHVSIHDRRRKVKDKKMIVEHQTEKDFAVINADYLTSFEFGVAGSGQTYFFSRRKSVDLGAFVENDKIILRTKD